MAGIETATVAERVTTTPHSERFGNIANVGGSAVVMKTQMRLTFTCKCLVNETFSQPRTVRISGDRYQFRRVPEKRGQPRFWQGEGNAWCRTVRRGLGSARCGKVKTVISFS